MTKESVYWCFIMFIVPIKTFFVSDTEFLTVNKLDLSDLESNVQTMITPEEIKCEENQTLPVNSFNDYITMGKQQKNYFTLNDLYRDNIASLLVVILHSKDLQWCDNVYLHVILPVLDFPPEP